MINIIVHVVEEDFCDLKFEQALTTTKESQFNKKNLTIKLVPPRRLVFVYLAKV